MFQASFKERIKQVKFHGNIFNLGHQKYIAQYLLFNTLIMILTDFFFGV